MYPEDMRDVAFILLAVTACTPSQSKTEAEKQLEDAYAGIAAAESAKTRESIIAELAELQAAQLDMQVERAALTARAEAEPDQAEKTHLHGEIKILEKKLEANAEDQAATNERLGT